MYCWKENCEVINHTFLLISVSDAQNEQQIFETLFFLHFADSLHLPVVCINQVLQKKEFVSYVANLGTEARFEIWG